MKKIIMLLFGTFSFFVFLLSVNAAFSDVSADHPNSDAINYVQEEKIVQGYEDGSFKPDQLINRAEFTKIIIEAVFPNQAIGSNCFSDVKAEWFAKYICIAKDKNIIGGYPDGTFRPAQNISFVEAAKIIVLAFGNEVASDPVWYKPFVEILGNEKSIPVSINEFTHNITRGEMAEMIYRLRADITNKESQTYAKMAGIEEDPAPICVDQCGDGECQQIVCHGEGCPCAENEASCAEDCKIETPDPAEYLDYSEESYQALLGNEAFALFFHAEWCPLCRNLEKDIVDQLAEFPDGTKILKVNYDNETALRQEYEITVQASMVIVNAAGEVSEKLLYGPKIEEVKEAITKSL